jgi:hypothetical protein
MSTTGTIKVVRGRYVLLYLWLNTIRLLCGLQRSIRHLLSQQALFVKAKRTPFDVGKGNVWGLNVKKAGELKRPRKRGPGGKRQAVEDEDEDEDDEKNEEGGRGPDDGDDEEMNEPTWVGRLSSGSHRSASVSSTGSSLINSYASTSHYSSRGSSYPPTQRVDRHSLRASPSASSIRFSEEPEHPSRGHDSRRSVSRQSSMPFHRPTPPHYPSSHVRDETHPLMTASQQTYSTASGYANARRIPASGRGIQPAPSAYPSSTMHARTIAPSPRGYPDIRVGEEVLDSVYRSPGPSYRPPSTQAAHYGGDSQPMPHPRAVPMQYQHPPGGTGSNYPEWFNAVEEEYGESSSTSSSGRGRGPGGC